MITSVNLASTPFISQTDSTRLQMSSKQVQQTLTCPECEIPFVISQDYPHISRNSQIGILFAEDDGIVQYNDNNIIIIVYKNLDQIKTYQIPPFKKCSANYASKLRFSLKEDNKFKKGDIIYEYDNFLNGIPSFGYNTMTAFMTMFGFNHEDSQVFSESFVNKAKAQYVDKVYIPIYEYTILQKFYNNIEGSFEYFPSIGQKIIKDIVCCYFVPKNVEHVKIQNPTDIKNKILLLMKNMNMSDLINMDIQGNSSLIINKVKSNIEEGYVSGFRIHKLKRDINLLDIQLQKLLEQLCTKYGDFVLDVYNNLTAKFNNNFVKKILKQHYIYTDRETERGYINLKNAVYLLEFEISKTNISYLGDKFANRYAGKGVISLILPDELRPVTVKNKTPIDYITNTFGVYSRMNLGQINELIIGKNVMFADQVIKNKPEKTKKIITWLNEFIIKNLNNDKYYEEINYLIKKLDDDYFKKEFIENVQKTNLFIEAPAFSEINVRKIVKNGINPQEDILIKKELIEFMEDKLKVLYEFKKRDCIVKNIFCGPMYIQKLYKIASKIVWARDLGSLKAISQQPLRGRALGGGSKIGQMEIEGILASGCEKALKELITVKSDWNEGKRDLVKQIISSGKYNFPDDISLSSRTKDVVETIIEFLKD
jgi:DNA-directed RNA polymerase beta subunit